MYPVTLLEAKHMNLINREDAIAILEKQNKYSDFDGIDALNKLPSADVLPISIISEIKSKVLEATWDNYYMPVRTLSADEISEIIDKVIDDFKGIKDEYLEDE